MDWFADALGATIQTQIKFVRAKGKSTSRWVFANDMATHAIMIPIGNMTDHDISQSVQQTVTEERAYLLKRAEDHRQLATKSTEPGAQSLHTRFQQLYLERARSDLNGTFEPVTTPKAPGTRSAIDG